MIDIPQKKFQYATKL